MKKIIYLCMFIVTSFAFGQNFLGSVNNYLNTNRTQLTLQPQDISDIVIAKHSFSKSMQLENVYVVQRYQGIEVFNSVSSFAIKNGQVINANLSFSNNLSEKINTTNVSISALTAINKAAQALNIGVPENLELLQTISANSFLYSNGNISLNNIPVKLVFQKMEDESLRLAWDLSIYITDSSHYYSVRIDAVNGTLLETHDWVLSCNFGEHSNTTHNKTINSVLFSNESSIAVNASGGAQYRVFAMPIESPNHGADALIADPSGFGDGSPFGWHDVNGVPGAEYTTTRGNNVLAQEDMNGNDGSGNSADGGDELLFDFPYNFEEDPSNMIEASTVNLFYWNNIMHDVWYQYGFDEASGNFQQNNYGNGGLGADFVLADAQDGSGINNANFVTPPDGINPRMQMFLWSGSSAPVELLTINNGPLAGLYSGVIANFGGDLPVPPLTEDIVVVNDGIAPDENDGCEPLTNGADLNGKIAIIRRGGCQFGFKAMAAQNEGAVAVIIVNNVPGTPVTMAPGDAGADVTIPLFMVTDVDGDAMIDELLGGGTLNGTISGENLPLGLRDGDLDNGIITHEYGHGISIRLTGGAADSGCLNNTEQMGEGWSDFFGMILTMKEGDQAEDKRGAGTYASGEPIDGNGIRSYPYSTNMSINPLTYEDLASTGGQVHAVGTIWASMLWELNWMLIQEHGFDSDFYNGTGGNNIAMQLVIDGLKLQVCSPGFVDGRDAILEADEIANNGENRCLIWNAFAKRGLGFSASQGNSNSISDGTPAYDIPDDCEFLGFNENELKNFIIYPNPSNGNINIRSLVNTGDASISIFDINGRKVFTQNVTLQNTVNINAERLRTGLYIIQIKGTDFSHSAKLIIN